jgi:EXLDI family protein
MQSTSFSTTNTPSERRLEEITVIVNGEGAHRRKRFMGVRLARRLQPSRDEDGTEILTVYRTAGNRYVLHTRSIQDWDVSDGDPDYAGDPKNWGVGNGWLRKLMTWGYDWETFKESGDYTLQVFETLEELKPHVSSDLYTAVDQAMDGPEIEDLDI